PILLFDGHAKRRAWLVEQRAPIARVSSLKPCSSRTITVRTARPFAFWSLLGATSKIPCECAPARSGFISPPTALTMLLSAGEGAARQVVGRVEVLEGVVVVAPARIELGEDKCHVNHGAPLVVLAALDSGVTREGHGRVGHLRGPGVSSPRSSRRRARSIDVGSAREGAHRAQLSVHREAVTYPP